MACCVVPSSPTVRMPGADSGKGGRPPRPPFMARPVASPRSHYAVIKQQARRARCPLVVAVLVAVHQRPRPSAHCHRSHLPQPPNQGPNEANFVMLGSSRVGAHELAPPGPKDSKQKADFGGGGTT